MLVFTLSLASKETRGLWRKQPGCVGSLWLQHRKLSAVSSSGVQQQPELQGCPGSVLPWVRCLRPFFFRVWVCWQLSPILCELLEQLFHLPDTSLAFCSTCGASLLTQRVGALVGDQSWSQELQDGAAFPCPPRALHCSCPRTSQFHIAARILLICRPAERGDLEALV